MIKDELNKLLEECPKAKFSADTYKDKILDLCHAHISSATFKSGRNGFGALADDIIRLICPEYLAPYEQEAACTQ